MTNKLAAIVLEKKREVAALYELIKQQPDHMLAQLLLEKNPPRQLKNFKAALQQPSLAVIAEIKRKSPSKGEIAIISNPADLVHHYVSGGAKAISILTDEIFFGGSLQDLRQVADALAISPIPLLRKDFIIDQIQIAQAVLAGADAILFIVAVLGNKTKAMMAHARNIGIDVLVEVHDRAELEIAIESGASIIGINNRNLTNFTIDTELAFQLAADIPSTIIKVAESGITTPALAQMYYRQGFNAVLIGESLVTSSEPAQFIQACQSC